MRVTREGAAMELVVLDLGAGELRVSFSMAITNSTYNPLSARPSSVRRPIARHVAIPDAARSAANFQPVSPCFRRPIR